MYLVEYVIRVRIRLLFEANHSNKLTFVTVAFVYYSLGARQFLVFKLKLTSSHEVWKLLINETLRKCVNAT